MILDIYILFVLNLIVFRKAYFRTKEMSDAIAINSDVSVTPYHMAMDQIIMENSLNVYDDKTIGSGDREERHQSSVPTSCCCLL